METLFDTGNGELPYDEFVRHRDGGGRAESELGKLGLNEVGGVDGVAGCGD